MIKSRMVPFSNLSQDERQDILSEQQSKLLTRIYTFKWENYMSDHSPVRAIASFTKYIAKATGSFFALDRIQGQRSRPLMWLNSQNRRVPVREVEEIVVETESLAMIDLAFTHLRQRMPDINTDALLGKIEGKTSTRLAREAGVSNAAVKKRVNTARKALVQILREMDIVDSTTIGHTKDTRSFFKSRTELLKERRRVLLKKYPRYKDILPPKVRKSLEYFYGLNGENPAFNYLDTAKKTGLTLKSVRVYIPQGVRIIMGTQKPSQVSLEKQGQRNLFEIWYKNPDNFGLNATEADILLLYFKGGLRLDQIGKRLGFSDTTAGRRIERTLNKIRASKSP